MYDSEGNRTYRYTSSGGVQAGPMPSAGTPNVTQYSWDQRNR